MQVPEQYRAGNFRAIDDEENVCAGAIQGACGQVQTQQVPVR
jgi:hypothetical protein